jgi:hypothetical protein
MVDAMSFSLGSKGVGAGSRRRRADQADQPIFLAFSKASSMPPTM